MTASELEVGGLRDHAPSELEALKPAVPTVPSGALRSPGPGPRAGLMPRAHGWWQD